MVHHTRRFSRDAAQFSGFLREKEGRPSYKALRNSLGVTPVTHQKTLLKWLGLVVADFEREVDETADVSRKAGFPAEELREMTGIEVDFSVMPFDDDPVADNQAESRA